MIKNCSFFFLPTEKRKVEIVFKRKRILKSVFSFSSQKEVPKIVSKFFFILKMLTSELEFLRPAFLTIDSQFFEFQNSKTSTKKCLNY